MDNGLPRWTALIISFPIPYQFNSTWKKVIHILKKQRGCLSFTQAANSTSFSQLSASDSAPFRAENKKTPPVQLTQLIFFPFLFPLLLFLFPLSFWAAPSMKVSLNCNYQQGPMDSHFTLSMETVRISEMLALQPKLTQCHHPETGFTLANHEQFILWRVLR